MKLMWAEGGGTKAYVLRSLLPAALRTRFVQADAPDVGRAFAMVVLSIINLAGGSTTEGAPPHSCTYDLYMHPMLVGYIKASTCLHGRNTSCNQEIATCIHPAGWCILGALQDALQRSVLHPADEVL